MLRRATAGRPEVTIPALSVVAALVTASVLVAILESALTISNASSVYLLAVVAIAIRFGTVPAIATAVGGVVAYNFLFVEPRFSLTVGLPDELLTLFLLLFVGVVSARLAGLQRDREQVALRREREAQALFGISRELATSERLTDAMQSVVGRLATEAGMERTWVGLGATVAHERVVADSGGLTAARPAVGTHAVLQRDREEGAATWMRIHPPGIAGGRRGASGQSSSRGGVFRVQLRSGESSVGSLWSQRADAAGQPHLEETRLLAVAADQLGQAIRRERLQAQAAELEIARRSDELKSALVDSVSHDLRTPLATIRAAAGSLADPHMELSSDDRRMAALAIDTEADRLNRLVGNLLDMSRIQGGALIADLEDIPLRDLVHPAVERARSLGGRPIELVVPSDGPSVRADAALLDRVVSNLLDNALKYSGSDARIRVRSEANPDATVSLIVEDGGAGVPDEELPRLFDRFHRVRVPNEGPRRGFGLGLAVVDGFVAAMGGGVAAARSSLGGLAVTVVLPMAPTR